MRHFDSFKRREKMQRILAWGQETAAIGNSLRGAGHSVASIDLCARSVEVSIDLYDAFSGLPPDILLVDLVRSPDNLPIRHLRSLIREIWGERIPMPPCLALVTRHHLSSPDLPTVVDDILLPPYEYCEAVARLTFLLFRFRHIRGSNTLRWADVTLDLDKGVALDCHDRKLPLTPREFNLLAFLCSHRGKFFSRENLLNLVWGVQFEGNERTVDIHIRRLRAKLPTRAADFLETRRGMGYGLSDPQ